MGDEIISHGLHSRVRPDQEERRRPEEKRKKRTEEGMCKKRNELAIQALHLLNVPWSIILDIVLLNLLDVVICLRAIHALGILPRHITHQTQDSQHKSLEPKHRTRVQPRHNASVLHGEVESRRHGAIRGDEDIPDGHAAGDSQHMVLGPVVGHKSGLA